MANQLRPEDLECPLSTALAYVGDWWTLLLLHDLFDGYTRFDQFQQNLGISSSILTTRLKTLQRTRSSSAVAIKPIHPAMSIC